MESSIKSLQISFPQAKVVDNSTKGLQSDEQKNSFQKMFDKKKRETTKETKNQAVQTNKTDRNDTNDEKETITDVTDSPSSLDMAQCIFFMNFQNPEPVLSGAAEAEVAIVQIQTVEVPKEKNEMISNASMQNVKEETVVAFTEIEELKQKQGNLKKETSVIENATKEALVSGQLNVGKSDIATKKIVSLDQVQVENVASKEASKDTGDETKELHITQNSEQEVMNINSAENLAGSLQKTTEVNTIQKPGEVMVSVKTPEELPQKILDTLNDKLALKQKEFEIQIEPYNLGKIAIKVAYEQNSTTISIVCS
ncbi:MAG: hypothetical protein PHX08_25525, partial [Lachnospiraceae bacterium]|nr:hypothetical protein [Lachnospiraceae bacterium]